MFTGNKKRSSNSDRNKLGNRGTIHCSIFKQLKADTFSQWYQALR